MNKPMHSPGSHGDRELQALTSDLESAPRQNRVVAFFNNNNDVSSNTSMDSHDQSLTGIITGLTVSNPSFLPFRQS